MSTLLIAEAGVNHNGSLDLARRLIDAAAEAGVDYVKFQTFKADNLVNRSAKKAEYQIRNTGDCGDSQYDMLRKPELSEADHQALIKHCEERGIRFLSTAFDLESIALLDRLGLPLWKIPSGEITHFPYLRAIGRTEKPVILSTGMAHVDEIAEAIDTLTRFGTPRQDITLLHCTTEYPAPKNEVNLRAIQTLHERFGLPVGYSDHTEGIEIPVAAVALGATVIEKHFTLDRAMEGPDHKASLEPNDLRQMVQSIRSVEEAIGTGIKEASRSERKNIEIARKSIVAARPIARGERLTDENLTAKRPAGGLSPMLWEQVIDTRAPRDFATDEPIEL
jgi:N,N'-diacetyllegionaminate synthase